MAVLAAQVELKKFSPRQRIWKIGETGGRAYVLISGSVRVTTVDEDHQEVLVDEPVPGEFFGFASMLDGTPHQTEAVAMEEAGCIESGRNGITHLVSKKPDAGPELVSGFGPQFHNGQRLGKVRANR